MADLKTARQVLEHLIEVQPVEDTGHKEVSRIGDLAREFDVSLRTLRFYEDRGLLNPQRSGSSRLYSLADRQRLILILTAKHMGFSLFDIEELLQMYDDDSSDTAAANLLREKLNSQMNILIARKSEIEQAIASLQIVTCKTQ